MNPLPFFMPTIGSELALPLGLTFPLYGEYRNHSLWEALDLVGPITAQQQYWSDRNYQFDPDKNYATVSLPEGTCLKLDRIYIRKGQDDFDSLTWFITASPNRNLLSKKLGGPHSKMVRFWIKVPDMQNTTVIWRHDQ